MRAMMARSRRASSSRSDSASAEVRSTSRWWNSGYSSSINATPAGVIDTSTRRPVDEIGLDVRFPGAMYVDATRGVIYVLGFLSDDIAVLDAADGSSVGVIR